MNFRAPALLPLLGAIALLLTQAACIDLGGFALKRQPFVETVVYGDTGPRILMLEIQGAITDYETPGFLGTGAEGTVARVREQLKAAEVMDIKAILLRVDSPGGTASASELVYRELLAYKERTGNPIVAQFMSTAASGGYYVAMAADEIQAYPTTITGSIGVIGSGVNFSGLMEKLGVTNQTITSGAFKDTGSPMRPMRDDERAYMQTIIDELYARFFEVVLAGRPELDAERLETIADGRIYSANGALEAGLIDRIAGIEEAIDRLETLAGLSESQVVSYHRSSEWRNNLYTQVPASSGPPVLQLDLRQVFGHLPSPGFHYLWLPQLD
jgi:protease-4